jgi:chaperonin GroES
MTIKPLSNKILLKPLDNETTTKSGIVLPENAGEKPTKGEVVAVGPGKRDEKGTIIPMSVKVGDRVLYKKYGPDEIEIDGEKYVIGDEDDILGIIE